MDNNNKDVTDNIVGFEDSTVEKITISLQSAVKVSKERLATCLETGCSDKKNFYDIIYIPHERCFWLITKETADALGYAASQFPKIVDGEDNTACLEKLNELRVLDVFITPDLVSFLSEEEQKEYKDNEARIIQLKKSHSTLGYNIPEYTRGGISDADKKINNKLSSIGWKQKRFREKAKKNCRVAELCSCR